MSCIEETIEKYELFRLSPRVPKELIVEMVDFVKAKAEAAHDKFVAEYEADKASAQFDRSYLDDRLKKDLDFIPSMARLYQEQWLRSKGMLMGQ